MNHIDTDYEPGDGPARTIRLWFTSEKVSAGSSRARPLFGQGSTWDWQHTLARQEAIPPDPPLTPAESDSNVWWFAQEATRERCDRIAEQSST